MRSMTRDGIEVGPGEKLRRGMDGSKALSEPISGSPGGAAEDAKRTDAACERGGAEVARSGAR